MISKIRSKNKLFKQKNFQLNFLKKLKNFNCQYLAIAFLKFLISGETSKKENLMIL